MLNSKLTIEVILKHLAVEKKNWLADTGTYSSLGPSE